MKYIFEDDDGRQVEFQETSSRKSPARRLKNLLLSEVCNGGALWSRGKLRLELPDKGSEDSGATLIAKCLARLRPGLLTDLRGPFPGLHTDAFFASKDVCHPLLQATGLAWRPTFSLDTIADYESKRAHTKRSTVAAVDLAVETHSLVDVERLHADLAEDAVSVDSADTSLTLLACDRVGEIISRARKDMNLAEEEDEERAQRWPVRLLLVDDENAIWSTPLAGALRAGGFEPELQSAANRETYKAHTGKDPSAFDVVIFDRYLPDWNRGDPTSGAKLIELYSTRDHHHPVVVALSSTRRHHVLREMVVAGADVALQKEGGIAEGAAMLRDALIAVATEACGLGRTLLRLASIAMDDPEARFALRGWRRARSDDLRARIAASISGSAPRNGSALLSHAELIDAAMPMTYLVESNTVNARLQQQMTVPKDYWDQLWWSEVDLLLVFQTTQELADVQMHSSIADRIVRYVSVVSVNDLEEPTGNSLKDEVTREWLQLAHLADNAAIQRLAAWRAHELLVPPPARAVPAAPTGAPEVSLKEFESDNRPNPPQGSDYLDAQHSVGSQPAAALAAKLGAALFQELPWVWSVDRCSAYWDATPPVAHEVYATRGARDYKHSKDVDDQSHIYVRLNLDVPKGTAPHTSVSLCIQVGPPYGPAMTAAQKEAAMMMVRETMAQICNRSIGGH